MACKLRLDVQDYLDPFQYAYSHGRGTYDAVNIVVHLILKHLDKPNAYARLLFIDFILVYLLMRDGVHNIYSSRMVYTAYTHERCSQHNLRIRDGVQNIYSREMKSTTFTH